MTSPGGSWNRPKH